VPSPYEELEYLAEHLPDEGEALLVRREGGELHCEPMATDSLRDGIDDVELYGRLVQANERLNSQGTLPLWSAAVGVTLLAIAIYRGFGLGWTEWFVLPMLSLLALFGCFHWIRARQRALFEREIRPAIMRELMVRNLSPYALIAGVRQHVEFRTLLDELVRWEPTRPQSPRKS
jgi:hypothetical protein